MGSKPPVLIQSKQSLVNGKMENNRHSLQGGGGIVVLIGVRITRVYISDKRGNSYRVHHPAAKHTNPPPPPAAVTCLCVGGGVVDVEMNEWRHVGNPSTDNTH